MKIKFLERNFLKFNDLDEKWDSLIKKTLLFLSIIAKNRNFMKPTNENFIKKQVKNSSKRNAKKPDRLSPISLKSDFGQLFTEKSGSKISISTMV